LSILLMFRRTSLLYVQSRKSDFCGHNRQFPHTTFFLVSKESYCFLYFFSGFAISSNPHFFPPFSNPQGSLPLDPPRQEWFPFFHLRTFPRSVSHIPPAVVSLRAVVPPFPFPSSHPFLWLSPSLLSLPPLAFLKRVSFLGKGTTLTSPSQTFCGLSGVLEPIPKEPAWLSCCSTLILLDCVFTSPTHLLGVLSLPSFPRFPGLYQRRLCDVLILFIISTLFSFREVCFCAK